MKRQLLALLVLVMAVPLGSAGAPLDPRVERANGLLASESTYAEAEALYRAVLADAPGEDAVRLQLARLLSWSDRLPEALEEYERVVAARPDDRPLRIERAEVLSWAGRYPEAIAELDAVLEREPDDARALRALARTCRWAGDAARADAAYARALELEEDAEARSEWQQLRADFRPALRAFGELFADSGDFRRSRTGVEAHGFRDLATPVWARLAQLRASHPQRDVAPGVRSAHGHDRGTELAAGLERRVDERWQLGAEAGVRDWRFAPDRGFAKLSAQFSPAGATTLGLGAEYGQQLDLSDSYEALQAGLWQTGLSASLWRGFSPRFEGWLGLRLHHVSDGNLRQSADASLSWRPWPAREQLLVSLIGSALRYSDHSRYYYDPSRDLGVALGLQDRFRLRPDLWVELGGQLGYGSTHTRAGSGSGDNSSVRGDLVWTPGAWRLALHGEASVSQRDASYRANYVRLEISRSF